MLNIDQDIFAENLLLTQIYCEEQLKNTDKSDAEILRSINPIRDGSPVLSFVPGPYSSVEWSMNLYEADVCDDLFNEQMLHKRHLVSPNTGTFEGRILVTEIDSTTKDGASENCTNGFIDIYDCPPIDTWFYLTRGNVGRIIFAWIPNRFLKITQVGIDVNILESFNWQSDWKDVATAPAAKHQTPRSYTKSKRTWPTILFVILILIIIYILTIFIK